MADAFDPFPQDGGRRDRPPALPPKREPSFISRQSCLDRTSPSANKPVPLPRRSAKSPAGPAGSSGFPAPVQRAEGPEKNRPQPTPRPTPKPRTVRSKASPSERGQEDGSSTENTSPRDSISPDGEMSDVSGVSPRENANTSSGDLVGLDNSFPPDAETMARMVDEMVENKLKQEERAAADSLASLSPVVGGLSVSGNTSSLMASTPSALSLSPSAAPNISDPFMSSFTSPLIPSPSASSERTLVNASQLAPSSSALDSSGLLVADENVYESIWRPTTNTRASVHLIDLGPDAHDSGIITFVPGSATASVDATEAGASVRDVGGNDFEEEDERDIYEQPPPFLPPPPLPMGISKHSLVAPPPIPPRPEAGSAGGQSLQSIPPREPDSNIFMELETPKETLFKDDPFKYSSFGAVCKDFNRDPPSALAQSSGDQDPSEPNPLYDYSHYQGSVHESSWGSAFTVGGLGFSSQAPMVYGRQEAPPREKKRVSLSHVPPAPGVVSTSSSSSVREDSDSLYSLADDSVIGSDSSDDQLDFGPFPIPSTTEPSQRKKNERDGYLYKQGGVKANKGWRRRWVIFNGQDLRYYSNETSQISKRIIRLSCMQGVEPDIKPDDTSRYKFKITTTMNGRVFVFAAESLEDALKWCNTIMAAIHQYAKNKNDLDQDTGAEVPDKKGYIRFENGGRRYFVSIQGSILKYYHTDQDYKFDSPANEIDMKLASVKDYGKGNTKLKLSTNYAHFILAFDAAQECQQWKLAIEDAIAEGLADDMVLEKVCENESNKTCADCGSSDPHWASINLGITLCKKCAGIHRNFDYTISKVKSLRMDTRVWTPSLIELMRAIGNANANELWEGELRAGQKLDAGATVEQRMLYIQNKYRDKRFCRRHPNHADISILNAIMLQIASTDNVTKLMQIVFSGADILYQDPNTEETAYQVAKSAGQRLQMEFLYQNGGVRSTPDVFDNDEGRAREDVQLQGYLLKTGPNAKSFERRWCVLEHGTLSYYVSEQSNTAKDSIERKNILCLWQASTDKQALAFEISTNRNANRIYLFAAECDDDRREWMQSLAKLICPVSVMDHVGMMEFLLAGNFYVKDAMAEVWRRSWLMLCGRTLLFVDKLSPPSDEVMHSMKMESLDLRKVSNIKFQDADLSFKLGGEVGPHFVINTCNRALYIQADLSRDTERLFQAFEIAIKRSGATLMDQQLTNDDVPVIVERCLNHIENNGMTERGLFREGATNSKVQMLLDELRKNARAVRLDDHSINEIANCLKRFLRELADPLFTKEKYNKWIEIAAMPNHPGKLERYLSLMEKLPLVNYCTLKRLIVFLARLTEHESLNLMTVENVARCFAPSLMKSEDSHMNLPLEMHVMTDVITHYESLFKVQKEDKSKQLALLEAKRKIDQATNDHRNSHIKGADTILMPFYETGSSESHMVPLTSHTTAADVLDYLVNKGRINRNKAVLLEVIHKESLTRPVFWGDLVMSATMRWSDWEEDIRSTAKLCVENSDFFDKLKASYKPGCSLSGELKYSEKKSFSKKYLEFKQMRLICYKDSKFSHESWSYNVEDLTIYKGVDMRRSSVPRYGFTFLVRGEIPQKGYFGRSVGMTSEEDLMKWLAALYFAQCPEALSGDSNGSFRP